MRMEPMLDSYNDNSTLQATCQQVGNPLLTSMAITYGENKSNEGLKHVRIAEYGCSGGRNSYEPMQVIISALRTKYPALCAECVLEDLPSNTWHQVMKEASKLTAAIGGKTHFLCAGTSFYNQICGDESVDLAYSFVATHFLSDTMPLASHVIMHEGTPAERMVWEAQAAKDWKDFLFLRARELKKHGKIMISTMSRDNSGYSWKEFSYLVWESIQNACSRSALTKLEAEALCIPACLRSEEDIMAPFSPGSHMDSLFEVNTLQFSRTEVESERNLPATVLAPLIRRRVEAVWGGVLLAQLKKLGRSDTSSRGVMGEVWDLFEEGISQDTARGWLDMRFFRLQLTKK